MKKKKVSAEELPRVPAPYEIRLRLNKYTLFKKFGNVQKVLHTLKSQSENGAHREAILFLMGKL